MGGESRDFTDIDGLVILLWTLDVLSEEVSDGVLENSNFWWPARD